MSRNNKEKRELPLVKHKKRINTANLIYFYLQQNWDKMLMLYIQKMLFFYKINNAELKKINSHHFGCI